MPKLSTLILSWNAKEQLRNCLRSYFDSTHSIDQEVIVLDNGSRDGSAAMVAKDFPPVQLIHSPNNLGYAEGNNRAYAASRGEYVLLLNDDVVVPSGTVAGLVRFLDEHPAAAGATCRLVNPDGTTQYGYHRRLPRPLDFIASLLHTYHLRLNNARARKFLMLDDDFQREEIIEQTAGTCLMLRRSAIEAAGGLFDADRFPILLNDTDLAKRLWDNGLRVWLVPSVHLTHLRSQSTERLDPYVFRKIFFTAMVLYYGKHGSFPEYLAVKLSLAALLTAYLAAVALGITQRYFSIPVGSRSESLAAQWKILRAVLTDERVETAGLRPT